MNSLAGALDCESAEEQRLSLKNLSTDSAVMLPALCSLSRTDSQYNSEDSYLPMSFLSVLMASVIKS